MHLLLLLRRRAPGLPGTGKGLLETRALHKRVKGDTRPQSRLRDDDWLRRPLPAPAPLPLTHSLTRPHLPAPRRGPRARPGRFTPLWQDGVQGPASRAPLRNRPAGRPRCAEGGRGGVAVEVRGGRRPRARRCRLTCPPVRARVGAGSGPAGVGGSVLRAPRLRRPGPSVRGSRLLPAPPHNLRRRHPGQKRLRGGAGPAALAGASGDGRAPSSDSSSQPPIRPQETESPCLASPLLLPPTQRPSRSPTHSPSRAPTLPSALTRSFPLRVLGKG